MKLKERMKEFEAEAEKLKQLQQQQNEKLKMTSPGGCEPPPRAPRATQQRRHASRSIDQYGLSLQRLLWPYCMPDGSYFLTSFLARFHLTVSAAAAALSRRLGGGAGRVR